MGASSPMLGHGFFLKWTRLQRFFFRLPIHFLHCLGFKLGWLFLRLSRLLCIGCVNSLLGCLVLFVPRLAPRVPKLFPSCLHFFVVYMCFSLGTVGLRCLGFILDYLCFFISILGFS
jgi:hypothetical protein